MVKLFVYKEVIDMRTLKTYGQATFVNKINRMFQKKQGYINIPVKISLSGLDEGGDEE